MGLFQRVDRFRGALLFRFSPSFLFFHRSGHLRERFFFSRDEGDGSSYSPQAARASERVLSNLKREVASQLRWAGRQGSESRFPSVWSARASTRAVRTANQADRGQTLMLQLAPSSARA